MLNNREISPFGPLVPNQGSFNFDRTDAMVRRCGSIIKRLPPERVPGYGRAWPETLTTWSDVLAQLERGGQGNRPVTNDGIARERMRLRPAPPSSAEIADLDRVLGWLIRYGAAEARTSYTILAMRMFKQSYATIGARLDLSKETIRRRYRQILQECES